MDATLNGLATDCPKLVDCTWGERNTTRIRHPLGPALAPLARWLDMPASVSWNSDAALNNATVPIDVVQAIVARIEESST